MNGDILSQLTASSGYIVFLVTSAGLYSLFALGLNLQWGLTGLINFGHVAFMTVGAYTTALLTLQGVPLIIAAIAGAGLAALLGLAIGTSTLRLREDYLAIVTIGVSELLRLVVLNEEWLTRGSFGVQRYPLPLNVRFNPIGELLLIGILTLLAIFAGWQLWQGLRRQWNESQLIKDKRPTKRVSLIIWGIIATALILVIYVNGVIALSNYTYKAGLMLLVLLVLALVYNALEFLARSPWGRILKAIREDEEIPRALGKNVFWYKLQAFMLGGAIAGIAGAFFAWQLTTIYPTNFEPLLTFNAWIIVVLGGAGSNAGTLLGAVIFWAYDTLTRFLLPQIGIQIGITNEAQLGGLRIMIIGLILMMLMIWRPQGILGKKEELTLGR
ncbi:MAG: branched-chain amino acid ABC transporter permease [Hydrococcus sp. C42_A2020_068]|uniref:branched-chain amino acid ABC transporter permease n=1 Tax=Pleurocapsa sp. PCC 7327 TaxID=118163 RepID=UPI00029FC59F|nr:branched-chain amino acid ABC transporter permease [Pleurocapsa sp. PCC 7327]AFY78997.1 ABC-type branched-chain amino acid transport system, permease component [Pleurocapsa sp. PCC 7327]MBF2021404.1 branched-chain amino acid ABC transporter permease [Hydrococcus sp. C42_A2020_068]